MKTGLLVFCLLLFAINCSEDDFMNECENQGYTNKESKCHDFNNGTYPDIHCCHIEYEYRRYYPEGDQKKFAGCTALTYNEYRNLRDKIKAYKKDMERSGYELNYYRIDCQSAFLKIGLVSLIIGLLF